MRRQRHTSLAAHVTLHIVEEELCPCRHQPWHCRRRSAPSGAFRENRIDGDNGNARGGGLLHGRHDAINVDGNDREPSTFCSEYRFDGAVLRGRVIVGVEDHQLGAGRVGRLCAPSFIC